MADSQSKLLKHTQAVVDRISELKAARIQLYAALYTTDPVMYDYAGGGPVPGVKIPPTDDKKMRRRRGAINTQIAATTDELHGLYQELDACKDNAVEYLQNRAGTPPI